MIDNEHKDHKNFVKIILELSDETQPNTFNQAVLSLNISIHIPGIKNVFSDVL